MAATAAPLMIPVDKIVVQEGHNARKSFDQKALKRLGKSISANDLIEPLSVRPIDGGKFMLLAGERRLRAAKLEGIKELPGHVNTKGNARTIALVENIQREQLNTVEEAEGRIPTVSIGRTRRYRRESILEWLEQIESPGGRV